MLEKYIEWTDSTPFNTSFLRMLGVVFVATVLVCGGELRRGREAGAVPQGTSVVPPSGSDTSRLTQNPEPRVPDRAGRDRGGCADRARRVRARRRPEAARPRRRHRVPPAREQPGRRARLHPPVRLPDPARRPADGRVPAALPRAAGGAVLPRVPRASTPNGCSSASSEPGPSCSSAFSAAAWVGRSSASSRRRSPPSTRCCSWAKPCSWRSPSTCCS